jgi:hypothetical protein
MHVGGYFCALAMAFICLNHEILLSTGCKGCSQKFKVLKLITPVGKMYNMGPSGISFRSTVYHNTYNTEYWLVLDLKVHAEVYSRNLVS